ncbi:MAG: phosphatidate cytidylyltransferase [Candidatus Heimdallarchaeota archaeon]|nr:phosphatidate cytidylyltransferase [Candidatus Heimdallarchaeota archaeon]
MKFFPAEFPLLQDILVLLITLIIIFVFIIVNFTLRRKGITSQYVTRKLIHLLAGPTLIISFFFYTGEWFSPYLAATVPLTFIILFYFIGTGKFKGESFVQSMSRSEDPKELLRGTFYYAIAGMFVTLFCFSSYPLEASSSPISILVVSTLAFGDGVADLFGRKINRMKYTIFAQKSIPGSISMLIFSVISCFLFFIAFGYDFALILWPSLIAIVAGTITEALSPSEVDNISIPITVVLIYAILAPFLAPNNPWSTFFIHLP